MAAYELLLELIKEYFISLGYNPTFVQEYISTKNFKEIACILLANANVMIRNKTDHSSHQTHIAVTGEMINFFCDTNQFKELDNQTILYWPVTISKANIDSLQHNPTEIEDPYCFEMVEGVVSWGKRTQSQVQLSKKNSLNSACFNSLRLGLYENDLLVMLKYRDIDQIFALGIPQTFYLDFMPNYGKKYETNTYLLLPNPRN